MVHRLKKSDSQIALTTVIKAVCYLVSNDVADSAIIEVSEIQIIYLLF